MDRFEQKIAPTKVCPACGADVRGQYVRQESGRYNKKYRRFFFYDFRCVCGWIKEGVSYDFKKVSADG